MFQRTLGLNTGLEFALLVGSDGVDVAELTHGFVTLTYVDGWEYVEK